MSCKCLQMNANGPAIKGGCVTQREHRAGSWYFSQKVVTVQGGYGTCFCRQGTILIACWRSRGTSFLRGYKLSRLQGIDKWALAQCRGTSCLGARNLSRCRNLIACRCANPDLTPKRFCLGSRSKSKNRDKQLTFIVRVMRSLFFFCY
jgi:hypothetical protein